LEKYYKHIKASAKQPWLLQIKLPQTTVTECSKFVHQNDPASAMPSQINGDTVNNVNLKVEDISATDKWSA
jgi:hypothetical protein